MIARIVGVAFITFLCLRGTIALCMDYMRKEDELARYRSQKDSEK